MSLDKIYRIWITETRPELNKCNGEPEYHIYDYAKTGDGFGPSAFEENIFYLYLFPSITIRRNRILQDCLP